MRILVTGATGFIGHHVIACLLAKGHEVRALARVTSDVRGLPPAVDVVRAELDEAAGACVGMDGLIHLAGISGTILKRKDPGVELQRVNVEHSRALFGKAREAGVRRGALITSMWTVLQPELARRSAYVKSRVDSEHAVLEASGETLSTTILCPTFVVGANDRGPSFPGSLVLALYRGRFPVLPPGGSMWISAADAADAVVAAIERGEQGRRHILGAEYLTHREVAEIVHASGGARPPRLTAPNRVLRFASATADAGLAIAGRRMPIPLRFASRLLAQSSAVDCTNDWAALGRPKVAVRDAVVDAISWFRANRYVDA